jgi:virginiamycin B lyase
MWREENVSTQSDLLNRFWRIALKALFLVAVICAAVLSSAQSTIKINEYPLPQATSNPWSLVAGPDGALWFTESCPSFYCPNNTHDAIGRITTSGAITEFALPNGSAPYGISAGPDGALWFTELQGNKIGRITLAGIITEFPLPTPNAGPYQITAGSDGALWFTEGPANRIGRITTTGVVTEYPVQGVCCSTDPTEVIAGPDGALWFTNVNSNWIGRITTQGTITKYQMPVPSGGYGIVVGPDGAFWFTGASAAGTAAIWRLTTNGVFSMYNVPAQSPGLSYITPATDKALWFTENYTGKIGRMTTAGAFTDYFVGGTFGTGPVAITTGPDGAVWYGKFGYIGQIVLPDSTPPRITISASPITLWPPNGRMVPVVVRGTVADTGSGMLAGSVLYAVTDEYHQVQPSGHIALNSTGKYAFMVLLQASRYGSDKDGRQYLIQVGATDNAGNRGVKSVRVSVPHNP